MVATVLAPDAGELRLLGLDPADPRERVEIRRRLGYLPQSPGLYPGFTPFDLVDYVAVLKEHTDRDWRRHEARRVLESVGLEDVMHRKIRGLSGGMKQRVALAAAMVGSPELLVLDEPANGLDPEQRLQLRSLLSQSQTVLMSTHNISEVSALCHRVYVMFAGRVRFAGTPAELAGLAAGRVWEDDRPGSAGDPQLADGDRHLPPPRRPARRRAGRRPDARRRLPPARQTRALRHDRLARPDRPGDAWQPLAAVAVFLAVVSGARRERRALADRPVRRRGRRGGGGRRGRRTAGPCSGPAVGGPDVCLRCGGHVAWRCSSRSGSRSGSRTCGRHRRSFPLWAGRSARSSR